MRNLACLLAVVAAFLYTPRVMANQTLYAEIDKRAETIEKKVIEWRRDIHQYPELSNREFRTGKLVAEHLKRLGLKVQSPVAITGVVGLLEGDLPGPVVALRADIDALPVAEETGLPFASKVKGEYNGEEVSVMHACGHDNHTAILMGVAEVLAGMKAQIPGTVKFIFQPAEEGAPPGEQGGADLMVAEGVLENPKPGAIFGLHVIPQWEVGHVAFRAGGMMASSDRMRIVVRGKQTHGAKPWLGTDPIVVASQIVLALQTVASRQIDVTLAPAIVTVGSIHGGLRHNIIPDEVEMLGTIRAFDAEMREDIHRRVRQTITNIAEASGATTEVEIGDGTPVTYNDPDLVQKMAPTFDRVFGEGNVFETRRQTWAEDFSEYQKVIPGLYFYLGVRTPGADESLFPPNHNPKFMADEDALVMGIRALANLAIDYLHMQ